MKKAANRTRSMLSRKIKELDAYKVDQTFNTRENIDNRN
jgi:hypothetical protein